MFLVGCVCVCLCPSTVKVSSVWISWDTREQINNVVLKTLDSSASSLHHYFGMQNLTFQLAALSCSYTRSEHNHDLTSISLDLHSLLSGVAFGTHYILNWSAFTGFVIYLVKAKVTTNFSIESSPRKVLSQVQVPSSLYLKMSYFTSKDETPDRSKLERNDRI